MMLALVASVTLIVPAYAWDFSASGSVSATFNQTTEKPNKDDKSDGGPKKAKPGGKDNVVDADFEDIKEDKEKSA